MQKHRCSIEFIKPSSEENEKLIDDAIQSAALKIYEQLPLSDVRIRIQFNEKFSIPEFGIGGWCFNSDEINLSFVPKRESDWLLYLPRTLAHEWHHMARWRGCGYGTSLPDIMISEGLAQHFEIECFQGEPSFYSCILSEVQRREMIEAFKIECASTISYDHAKWFFGSAQFPFLGGYDLSFYLTGHYLKTTKSLASKELQLDSAELLKFFP